MNAEDSHGPNRNGRDAFAPGDINSHLPPHGSSARAVFARGIAALSALRTRSSVDDPTNVHGFLLEQASNPAIAEVNSHTRAPWDSSGYSGAAEAAAGPYRLSETLSFTPFDVPRDYPLDSDWRTLDASLLDTIRVDQADGHQELIQASKSGDVASAELSTAGGAINSHRGGVPDYRDLATASSQAFTTKSQSRPAPPQHHGSSQSGAGSAANLATAGSQENQLATHPAQSALISITPSVATLREGRRTQKTRELVLGQKNMSEASEAPGSTTTAPNSAQPPSGSRASSVSSKKGTRPKCTLPPEKVFPIQIGSELFRLSGASIASDGEYCDGGNP